LTEPTRRNTYDPRTDTIVLDAERAKAFEELDLNELLFALRFGIALRIMPAPRQRKTHHCQEVAGALL
jgi:hypothetical protein